MDRVERPPGDGHLRDRFEQAVLQAEVTTVDGAALDFRSVIELYDRSHIGVDPADPRARLTATGSLLSARRGLAVLRSPPIRFGRADIELVDRWAQQEIALLGRQLPIEGRVRPHGRPRVEDLVPVDPAPAAGGAAETGQDALAGRDAPAGRPRRADGPDVRGDRAHVRGGSAAEGTALLPYRALAVGWTGPGWRADVVVVAPQVVVIGLVDGTSSYVAAPIGDVPEVVTMLDRGDLPRVRLVASPVTILSRHWQLDHPTRSARLGPRRGFLRRR